MLFLRFGWSFTNPKTPRDPGTSDYDVTELQHPPLCAAGLALRDLQRGGPVVRLERDQAAALLLEGAREAVHLRDLRSPGA